MHSNKVQSLNSTISNKMDDESESKNDQLNYQSMQKLLNDQVYLLASLLNQNKPNENQINNQKIDEPSKAIYQF